MYQGIAERVHIDSEEDGFHLLVKCEDETWHDFKIQGIAVELLEEVKRTIGEWWAEGEQVRAEFDRLRFECDPDESAGYALDDPKHPTYHERMSAIYDNREGK